MSRFRFVQITTRETASPAEGPWEETPQSPGAAVAGTITAAAVVATAASISISEGAVRITTAWAGA